MCALLVLLLILLLLMLLAVLRLLLRCCVCTVGCGVLEEEAPVLESLRLEELEVIRYLGFRF